MTKKVKYFAMRFSAVLWLILSFNPVRAETACSRLATPLFGDQFEVIEARAYEEIRHHSISGLAHELKRKGIVPQFQLDPEEMTGLPSGKLGESIQTRMLVQILKTVFTDAQFKEPGHVAPEFDPKMRTILRVPVGVFDTAEDDSNWIESLWFHGHGHIEMSLLKTANPMKSLVGREFARNKLGIPADKKVLSVYFDLRNSGEGLGRLIAGMPAGHAPDILILSQSWLFNTDQPVIDRRVSQLAGMFPDAKVTKLSDFSTKKLPRDGKRLILFNDTKGRMPEVYAASDLAVVMAPNNIFESIRAGVPTLFFTNPMVLGDYNRAVFEKMAKTAEATGGGVDAKIPSKASLRLGFEKLAAIDRSKIKSPAFVIPGGEEKSAFTGLLDRIEALVRKSMR